MQRMIVAPVSIFDKFKEMIEDNKHLSDLDLEMKKILYCKKLNDFTKWQNYRQVLQKYLLLKKQKTQMFNNVIDKGPLVKTSNAMDNVALKNIKIEKIKREYPEEFDDDDDDGKSNDDDDEDEIPLKQIDDIGITPIKNISKKKIFYHDLSAENEFESASESNFHQNDEIGLNSTMKNTKTGRVLRSQIKRTKGEGKIDEKGLKWSWYK